jgi:hypothetical protein
MNTSETKLSDVVIVGASAAGLAVAACLKQEGISNITILEKADKVGAAWRRHYERLHLHTDKGSSHLPYLPFPADTPRYPSRRQVIHYLETYANQFDLQPHFGQMATNIEQIDGLWQVTTANGRYIGRNLVMATGYTNQPVVPIWPGQEQFKGQILHSSQYKNGADFAAKHVLVVGFGNSGGEIAIDLYEHGALPSISVRGPVNVIPRDILGIPILSIGILMSKLPTAVADVLAAPLLKLTIGDLSRYGLQKLPYGPNTQIARDGRIPLLDVGTVSLIKQGVLQVKPAIKRFDSEEVRFVDGQSQAYGAVVLATGYQPNLDVFANGIGSALDNAGQPLCSGQESPLTGLYFCGFYISPTGMLREIGIEARQIAQSIKAKKESTN